LPNVTFSQIDHWETAVFAEDIWKYKTGQNGFPSNWFAENFNDGNWDTGEGGFGYGDGDDGTNIGSTNSVFLRKTFDITDISKINSFILSADYDDGFVAYLNGEEFARANLGEVGTPAAYNENTFTDHEANLYQGQQPEYFQIENATDFLQNGQNILAIQVNNVNDFSSDLSSNFYLSLGINDTSNEYNPNPNWFVAPFEFFSSDLPLLIINTDGQEIMDEPRITANLGIIDNGTVQRNYLTDSFNGYVGQISIEIRGASSQSFPKKNYSFETQNNDGSNNNVSLLGMPEENDWILHGPFSDKSLMRNTLTYQFARNMGQYAPRTRACELVINGDYRGYYVLMERIKRDENRLDIANVKPEDIEGDELTGGYILQIDRDNEFLDDGWYSNYWPFTFYALNDPDYDEINTPQRDYIENFITDFEAAMNAPNYAQSYENWIDVNSFIDYILALEIVKEIDAYRLSFFMYKRKDSNGGKLHLGPIWDINLGYANFDYACDPSPEGWSYDWHNTCNQQAFWLKKIVNIPAVRNQMQCRWTELREDVLATTTLLDYIDNQATTIDEAQGRNFQRWPVLGQYVWPNSFVGNTYESEVTFLKNWLSDRLDWMDDNMNGDCSLVGVAEDLETTLTTHVFPNPFAAEINVLIQGQPFQNGEIRILNTLGQPVLKETIQANETLVLNNKNLPKGVYIYEIWVEGVRIETASLIKI
jgi:hypothetical protein